MHAGYVAGICNLQQNPSKRAIVSGIVPTLLRQGTMWVITNPDSSASDTEERMLFPKDCISFFLQSQVF